MKILFLIVLIIFYRGARVLTRLHFRRYYKYSFIAATDCYGMFTWKTINGAFNSEAFFKFIREKLFPKMVRYPGRRSILVLDNARIHKLSQLRAEAALLGIKVIALPSYCPNLNLIEFQFGVLKKMIQGLDVENEAMMFYLLNVLLKVIARGNWLKKMKEIGY